MNVSILFLGFSDCLDPEPAPDNGSLLVNKNENGTILAGAMAEYTCKDGFTLVGPSSKVCSETGEWLPLESAFCSIAGRTKLEKLLHKS